MSKDSSLYDLLKNIIDANKVNQFALGNAIYMADQALASHEAEPPGGEEELAIRFAEWIRTTEYGYHPVKKNWKLPHLPTTYTTEQLLQEFKKSKT